jgi:hypothetical protein
LAALSVIRLLSWGFIVGGRWPSMVRNGPSVGTGWARCGHGRYAYEAGVPARHASRRERSGRPGGVLPAGLGARVVDAYTEPCLSR